MDKLVTAVIITHNRKDCALMAVNSVFAQTYKNIELIMVDDASDDGSKEFFEEKASEMGFKYIYIPKEESKGGNHARNVGALNANGEYIAYLDDDDEWLDTKIEKQVNFLETHPDYGVVSCVKLNEYNMKKRVPADVNEKPEGDLSELVWTVVPFVTSAIMIRKDLLVEVGLFDDNLRFWQEYELGMRLAKVTKFGVIRENLLLYRIIIKDKSRLTNNINGWIEAVKYIENKHRETIDALPADIKKKHKLRIARDGALRCENIGYKKKKKYFLKEIAKLQPSFGNKVKYMLNIFSFSNSIRYFLYRNK